MQPTPATSSRGAGWLLPAGGVRAGSCLHMPEDDDAPSILASPGLRDTRCLGRQSSASRGQQQAQLHQPAPAARLVPWLLPVPGTVQSGTRSYHGHRRGSGASPARPPWPEPGALKVPFNASPGAAPGLTPAVSGTVTPAGPERWIPVAKIWIWF